ncbi:hypothetical protein SDC9_57255 [bioreactor metagenome]|uniref:Peptidase M50 domain-containing protein n=1 Tax=bioreactor metagenome TaxID=1076179 RepID=A0A644X535_9ZZZZ
MLLKTIKSVIPVVYWIFVPLALIFLINGGKDAEIGFAIINILLFLISHRVSVILHECGHVLFTLIAGGQVKRMTLGSLHKVFQKKIGKMKLVLNSRLTSGFVNVYFEDLKNIRVKLILVFSGGIAVNSTLVLLAWYISGFPENIFGNIHPVLCFGAANLYTLFLSVIPFPIKFNGIRTSNDALAIIGFLFNKNKDFRSYLYLADIYNANDLIEEKKYDEAIALLRGIQKKSNGFRSSDITISYAMLKKGEFGPALEILENLLPDVDKKYLKAYKYILYNNLAWNYLVMNRTAEAEKYSELAYNGSKNSDFIRGTRAAALIENGYYYMGKNIVLNYINFRFANSQNLCASMYCSLAYAGMGDWPNSEKYLRFVVNNSESLDEDEKVLFERVKNKIELLKQNPK